MAAGCCPCFFPAPAVPDKAPAKEQEMSTKDSGKRSSVHEQVQAKLFSSASNALDSGSFDLAVGFAILLNCLVMTLNLEYRGYLAEIHMGMATYDPDKWPKAKQMFDVLEHIFNAIFLCEMFIMFFVYGPKMCKDKSLLFDVSLVVASSIQLYILDPLSSNASGPAKFSLFRMLRFVRLVRVLRFVRVLKMFSTLRVLVRTVISSFGALFYSMLLLLIMMVMGGLFLCELLLDYIQDESNPFSKRQWVFKHYGTSTRAIYTLFEVTLAGCWPNYFRPLIHDVNGWFVIFVVIYIAFVVFAVIRIITAIFLRDTLKIASDDADEMVNEKQKSRLAYVKKLRSLFEAIDISGDGKLSEKEFELVMQSPKVKSWLGVLDLEIHDAKAVFGLLDTGNGEVTFDEFLKGLMRLKGQARTMDVVSIMQKADRTLDILSEISRKLDTGRMSISI